MDHRPPHTWVRPSIEDVHVRLLGERAEDQRDRDGAAQDLRRRIEAVRRGRAPFSGSGAAGSG